MDKIVKIVWILFLFQITIAFSQNKNYKVYYQEINKAEEYYFLKENIDSSLYYYNKAFEEFDFAYARDLINATQIAFFEKKEYRKFLIKGFEQGIDLNDLKDINLFDSVYKELVNDTSLLNKYIIAHNKYLHNIDSSYFNIIHAFYKKDQEDKNLPSYEYKEIKKIYKDKFKKWITEKGFPGEKLIGISVLDTNNLNDKLDTIITPFDTLYITTKGSYKRSLSMDYSFPALVHNKFSYLELKDFLITAMYKGEIHPREIGMLHDNMYRPIESNLDSSEVLDYKLSGVFKLNGFVDYSKYKCDNKEINSLREKFYIAPIEIDIKKKEYEKKYGFVLTWGFFNCL